MIMQAGDETQHNLSWWRWGHERYSPEKAQQGYRDRLCGVRSRSACQPPGVPELRSVQTAFLSRQPRIVALPTQRTNDSRLANSQWGADHGIHYSGAGVGPGLYDVHCRQRHTGYKAILHRHGHEDLRFPASLATKTTIVQLVQKHVPHSCQQMKADWCGPESRCHIKKFSMQVFRHEISSSWRHGRFSTQSELCASEGCQPCIMLATLKQNCKSKEKTSWHSTFGKGLILSMDGPSKICNSVLHY